MSSDIVFLDIREYASRRNQSAVTRTKVGHGLHRDMPLRSGTTAEDVRRRLDEMDTDKASARKLLAECFEAPGR